MSRYVTVACEMLDTGQYPAPITKLKILVGRFASYERVGMDWLGRGEAFVSQRSFKRSLGIIHAIGLIVENECDKVQGRMVRCLAEVPALVAKDGDTCSMAPPLDMKKAGVPPPPVGWTR